MDRPFTLFDIWTYQQEIKPSREGLNRNEAGPGKMALRNILAYSKALDVMNCRSTGNAFLLMN